MLISVTGIQDFEESKEENGNTSSSLAKGRKRERFLRGLKRIEGSGKENIQVSLQSCMPDRGNAHAIDLRGMEKRGEQEQVFLKRDQG